MSGQGREGLKILLGKLLSPLRVKHRQRPLNTSLMDQGNRQKLSERGRTGRGRFPKRMQARGVDGNRTLMGISDPPESDRGKRAEKLVIGKFGAGGGDENHLGPTRIDQEKERPLGFQKLSSSFHQD